MLAACAANALQEASSERSPQLERPTGPWRPDGEPGRLCDWDVPAAREKQRDRREECDRSEERDRGKERDRG